MNSPESFSKSYWTEEIRKLLNRIEESRAFIADSQNVLTFEGEDKSESMAEAEIELLQLETDLREARTGLARLEQQEEITQLLPRIEELRNQIEMHKKSDVGEARELETVLIGLEDRVEKLRENPVLDDAV